MMLECNYAQSNIFSCTDKKEVFLSCCSLGSASTTRNHQVRRRKRKSRRFSCSCWVLVHKRRTWLRPNFLCKQTGIRQTNFMSWLGMTCIDIFYVFDLFIDSRLVLLCYSKALQPADFADPFCNKEVFSFNPFSDVKRIEKSPWWRMLYVYGFLNLKWQKECNKT